MAIESEFRQSRRHRAASVLRELVPLISIGAVPDETLDSVASELEALLLRLAPYSRASRFDADIDAAREAPKLGTIYRPGHVVFGLANASSPPIAIEVQPDTAIGAICFGAAFEGPPGSVHGGWIASAFDCVMGQVARQSGSRVVTGVLSTRYLRPLPLHLPVRIEASLLRQEGRRITVEAKMIAADQTCAEATALFVAAGTRILVSPDALPPLRG